MGNRVYYQCPGGCGEVWAYSYWAGTTCWNCSKVIGTIAHGAVKTLPPTRVAETVVTAVADIKTEYKCNDCGSSVWAYGQFAGQDCWNCKAKNPFKAVSDIMGEVNIMK